MIELLRHLQRHFPANRKVFGEDAAIHPGRRVQASVASYGGPIVVERLPAWAPQLNPVEYLWGNPKTHRIGNLIATPAWASACKPPTPCDARNARFKQSTLSPE